MLINGGCYYNWDLLIYVFYRWEYFIKSSVCRILIVIFLNIWSGWFMNNFRLVHCSPKYIANFLMQTFYLSWCFTQYTCPVVLPWGADVGLFKRTAFAYDYFIAVQRILQMFLCKSFNVLVFYSIYLCGCAALGCLRRANYGDCNCYYTWNHI